MASLDVRDGVVTQSLLLILIGSSEREQNMYVQASIGLTYCYLHFLMNTVSKLKYELLKFSLVKLYTALC